MTRVHWLIEVGVFPRTAERVCAALEERGMAWTRFHDDVRESELPGRDEPVLFWGSLGAAYAEGVAAVWTPGAVGDVGRFACSAYLTGMADVPFANRDAVYTTVAELVSAPAAAVASLGAPERVFVRPDSPLKPFSGRQLAVTEVTLAALDHGFYYDDDQLPIVVSSPKAVGREWRFVVADGEVVAGCEYVASRDGAGSDVPDAARTLAHEVAGAVWQPAPLYVVDVGEVEGGLAVMELNPFSGADLYDCDADAVVEHASRVALGLFRDAR